MANNGLQVLSIHWYYVGASSAEWRLDQWKWTLALTPYRYYQLGISPGPIVAEELIHLSIYLCIHSAHA